MLRHRNSRSVARVVACGLAASKMREWRCGVDIWQVKTGNKSAFWWSNPGAFFGNASGVKAFAESFEIEGLIPLKYSPIPNVVRIHVAHSGGATSVFLSGDAAKVFACSLQALFDGAVNFAKFGTLPCSEGSFASFANFAEFDAKSTSLSTVQVMRVTARRVAVRVWLANATFSSALNLLSGNWMNKLVSLAWSGPFSTSPNQPLVTWGVGNLTSDMVNSLFGVLSPSLRSGSGSAPLPISQEALHLWSRFVMHLPRPALSMGQADFSRCLEDIDDISAGGALIEQSLSCTEGVWIGGGQAFGLGWVWDSNALVPLFLGLRSIAAGHALELTSLGSSVLFLARCSAAWGWREQLTQAVSANPKSGTRGPRVSGGSFQIECPSFAELALQQSPALTRFQFDQMLHSLARTFLIDAKLTFFHSPHTPVIFSPNLNAAFAASGASGQSSSGVVKPGSSTGFLNAAFRGRAFVSALRPRTVSVFPPAPGGIGSSQSGPDPIGIFKQDFAQNSVLKWTFPGPGNAWAVQSAATGSSLNWRTESAITCAGFDNMVALLAPSLYLGRPNGAWGSYVHGWATPKAYEPFRFPTESDLGGLRAWYFAVLNELKIVRENLAKKQVWETLNFGKPVTTKLTFDISPASGPLVSFASAIGEYEADVAQRGIGTVMGAVLQAALYVASLKNYVSTKSQSSPLAPPPNCETDNQLLMTFSACAAFYQAAAVACLTAKVATMSQIQMDSAFLNAANSAINFFGESRTDFGGSGVPPSIKGVLALGEDLIFDKVDKSFPKVSWSFMTFETEPGAWSAKFGAGTWSFWTFQYAGAVLSKLSSIVAIYWQNKSGSPQIFSSMVAIAYGKTGKYLPFSPHGA